MFCLFCLFMYFTVVIDRRANQAVDTGSFEMIYKQIIPPAPAYMGLNLFLKGQQLVSKPVSKRDKYRDESKTPRSSHVLQKSKQTPNQTTGPVIVDFMECLNMKTKNLPVVPSLGELRKLNGANMLKKSNPFPTSNIVRVNSNNKYLNIRSSITRTQNNKSWETGEKNTRAEFVRRHASCKAKHNHGSTADDSLISLSEPDSKHAKTELKCIGSKCLDTLDWDNDNNNNINNISNSMNVSPPLSSRIHQLFKSKSAPTISAHLQSVRKLRNSNQFHHYRKTIPENHEVNINKCSPNENSATTSNSGKANGSHFSAVGLSVKAWRAKYNKIMKSQKENIDRQLTPVARSCPPSLISRNRCKKITRQIHEI